MRNVSTSSDDWPRLATYLVDRAEELGLTQTEIQGRGGPSTTLWRDLKDGVRKNYARGTLAKIDRGLDWERGSARRILHGGEPVARPADPYINPSLVRLLAHLTAEEQQQIIDVIHARYDPPPPEHRDTA